MAEIRNIISDIWIIRILTGIQEILVIGSIFSTSPIETSGIHRAQDTWAHLEPVLVLFIAPPYRLLLCDW